MTRALHVVVPGSIDQRTGGSIYDRRIVGGLRGAGMAVTVHELPGRLPLVDPEAAAAAAGVVERLDRRALVVIDGLALPAFAGRVADLPPAWVALIHHPLALETGLTPPEAGRLGALEQDLLRHAARVIVTSESTASDLEAYGVPRARIGVVLPGTDPAPLARGSAGPAPAMLSVASVTERKGHALLVEALGPLRSLAWRLTCAGSLTRAPETAAALRAAIHRLRLEARVDLVGECPPLDLDRLYDGADLFVLASHHEGYGMALAEALARGLPVLSTTAGAIAETVPEGAGLLVPAGDVVTLRAALRRLLTDADLRRRLAAGARRTRVGLPTWPAACRAFAAELAKVDPAG